MIRSKSSNLGKRPVTQCTESTFATPRGFLSSRNTHIKTSLGTVPATARTPIRLRRNLHPLLHVPHRFLRPETCDSVYPPQKLNLRSSRDQISARLLASNADRRAFTDRILRNEKPHADSGNSRVNDHFWERYEAKEHMYTHALTGPVHLAPVTARLQGELNRRRGLKCSEELEEAKKRFQPAQTVTLTEPGLKPLMDKPWKAFSSVKHLMQLRVPTMFIPQLSELVPKKPYQHQHSFVFLQACRDGNVDRVRLLLLENRWLALTFDYVKQTGLHWAAKRGHESIIAVLVRAGTFLDGRDCTGRTALFIAARKGHKSVVKALLSLKANPGLRSNAGKSPQMVAKNIVIQKLVERAMLLKILMKFAPAEKRNIIWERQGLAYFRNDGEEEDSSDE